jgi:hypothetical protein
MDLDEAARVAGQHQRELSRAKFEQETQRDKTLVLIAGGALTLSFAFTSSLIEHGKVSGLRWLVAAWFAWGGALALAIVAYSLSIKAFETVIKALSVGDWSAASKTPVMAKCVEPVNTLVSLLIIAGFLAFGYFTVGILRGVAHEQAQANSQEKGGGHTGAQAEVDAHSSEQPAAAASKLPEGQKGEKGTALTAALPANLPHLMSVEEFMDRDPAEKPVAIAPPCKGDRATCEPGERIWEFFPGKLEAGDTISPNGLIYQQHK